LSGRDRLRARSLSKSLELGARFIREGVRSAPTVRRHMHRLLAKSVDRVHYVSAVDPETLEDVRQIAGRVLLAVAAKVGKARLIDNMIV
jgi:pantoate--beta-alanine ligase